MSRFQARAGRTDCAVQHSPNHRPYDSTATDHRPSHKAADHWPSAVVSTAEPAEPADRSAHTAATIMPTSPSSAPTSMRGHGDRAEVRETEKKNLAIEALKKLINGDVRSQAKRNVIQSKAFSERLEAAIARYHANAITTAQILEELIQLAKDIRAARLRGEETGLTDEEIAFYDALAENESARQVMGEPTLRVIAHELVTVIKGNVTVDWMHRESARANIRRHMKRLLRKYGYTPDLQDAAVQNLLQQAEALSAQWAA